MIVLPAGGSSWSSWRRGLLPLPDELDIWGWSHMGLALFPSLLLQDVGQRTLSWRYLYLPWLSAVLHPTRMCTNVPLPPHKQHSESSLIPHLCRFVGVESVSYTDQSRKEMRKGSSLQSSGHVNFLFGRSHLVQIPQPLTFAFRPPGVGPRLGSYISYALGLLSPIVGSGLSRVLVSPCTGSRRCPSTSACSQPATDVSAAHFACGDACISDLFIAGVSVHHHSPALCHLKLFDQILSRPNV